MLTSSQVPNHKSPKKPNLRSQVARIKDQGSGEDITGFASAQNDVCDERLVVNQAYDEVTALKKPSSVLSPYHVCLCLTTASSDDASPKNDHTAGGNSESAMLI